nr:MAG TPA: hypothetical protein [Caudoviricetes sp.]
MTCRRLQLLYIFFLQFEYFLNLQPIGSFPHWLLNLLF